MEINVFYKLHPTESGLRFSEKPKESTIDVTKERQQLSEEVLSGISNRDFLAVERNNRLEHITKPSVKGESLQVGSQVNFTFTFNNKFNTDLYRQTTAGQSLPAGVETISAYGSEWNRKGTEGEFFNEKGNRLIIREGTNITIVKVLSQDELTKKNEEISQSVGSIEDSDKKNFVVACLKRGIPMEIATSILTKERGEKKYDPTEVEAFLTEFQRIHDYYASDFQVQGSNFQSSEFLAYYINYKNISLQKEEFAQLGITDERLSKYKISNETRVFGSYGTNKPLSDTVKLLGDLNWEESQKLARKIFRDGPATELLIKLDGGTGTMIKRMVALGYHEGGLKFGRQNPDPASGYNIGTFQIGGSNSTPEVSMRKYTACLHAGVALGKELGIDAGSYDFSDPGQKDLMTHIGYIYTQRGGMQTLQRLGDSGLSDAQVIDLMSTKIQGGIPAIGLSVVSQMKNTRVDITA